MNTVTTGSEVMRREWRAIARLLLESCAAGVFVSLVLALAVFVVATQAQAADLGVPFACFDDDMQSMGSGGLFQAAIWVLLAAPAIVSAATAAAPLVAGMLVVGVASILIGRRRRVRVAHVASHDAIGTLERAARASRLVC